MPTTSDQPSNYQPIRFIVNDPGFDTELGLKGRGYSPDNGQTFIVQDTTDGRIYRVKDAQRLFPLLKPMFDETYNGGSVTTSLHWADILDKPELVTEDELKTIELTPGPPGQDGSPGKDGESAYQVAVDNGFVGTVQDWLKSLQGKPGRDGLNGEDGHDGQPGQDGKSAYQIAVEHGFVGSEAEWLQSLHGKGGSSTTTGDASLSIEAITDHIKQHLAAKVNTTTGQLEMSVDGVSDGSIVDSVALKVAQSLTWRLTNDGELVAQTGGA